jgi:hypothetical protein
MGNDLHKAYIDSGKCSSVSAHNSWCNGDANHKGPHYGLYWLPVGGVTKLYWTDSDKIPKPSGVIDCG